MACTQPLPPQRGRRLGYGLALSLVLNLLLAALLILALIGPTESNSSGLIERHFSGDVNASEKVAVVSATGLLTDTTAAQVLNQIERAARDESVKAVVVRINSPGGTISASETIHRALVHLRDNTHERFTGTGPKPLVASMGDMAASGGYYVAMPARSVVAEPTTITGSIGVFAALPNVSEFANEHGIKLILVKAGDLKGGGSPLQALSPEERQPWQDLVDHAYNRFLDVVSNGRKIARDQLVGARDTREVPKYDDKGDPIQGADGKIATVPVSRYRADGGIYTATRAKELGLIDTIGTLPQAIQLAADAASMNTYRGVVYEQPKSVVEQVLGIDLRQNTTSLSVDSVKASALTPQLWYLTPGFDIPARLQSW